MKTLTIGDNNKFKYDYSIENKDFTSNNSRNSYNKLSSDENNIGN